MVGNDRLEDVLRGVEGELVECRERTEAVNRARKAGQEGKRAQIEGLEAEWARGLGRVLETELAVREVEGEVRRVLRERGSGGPSRG